jgi:hypothetical protein
MRLCVVFALASSAGALVGTAGARFVAGGSEVVGAFFEQIGGLLVSHTRGFLGPVLAPAGHHRCLLRDAAITQGVGELLLQPLGASLSCSSALACSICSLPGLGGALR